MFGRVVICCLKSGHVPQSRKKCNDWVFFSSTAQNFAKRPWSLISAPYDLLYRPFRPFHPWSSCPGFPAVAHWPKPPPLLNMSGKERHINPTHLWYSSLHRILFSKLSPQVELQWISKNTSTQGPPQTCLSRINYQGKPFHKTSTPPRLILAWAISNGIWTS